LFRHGSRARIVNIELITHVKMLQQAGTSSSMIFLSEVRIL
jgi:hypothetical protein